MGFEGLVNKNNELEEQEKEINSLEEVLYNKVLNYKSKYEDYYKTEKYTTASKKFIDNIVNGFYNFFSQKGFIVSKDIYKEEVDIKAELPKIELSIRLRALCIDEEIKIYSWEGGYGKFQYDFEIKENIDFQKESKVFIDFNNKLQYTYHNKASVTQYLKSELEKIDRDIITMEQKIHEKEPITLRLHWASEDKNYTSIEEVLDMIEKVHFN